MIVFKQLSLEEEKETKEKMISLIGPISDAYTKALDIELAKEGPHNGAMDLTLECLEGLDKDVLETLVEVSKEIPDENSTPITVYADLGKKFDNESLTEAAASLIENSENGQVFVIVDGDGSTEVIEELVAPIAALESIVNRIGGVLYKSFEDFSNNFSKDLKHTFKKE